jgi:hypothetical protein
MIASVDTATAAKTARHDRFLRASAHSKANIAAAW